MYYYLEKSRSKYWNCPNNLSQEKIEDKMDNFRKFKKKVGKMKDHEIEKLLITSCTKGIIRNVEYLLPIIVNKGLQESIDVSLCAASKNCHLAIIDLLVKYGADIGYKDGKPLIDAVCNGQTESVAKLIEYGADVHTNDDTLIVKCCKSGDYVDVIKILVLNGIDVLKHYHSAITSCLDLGREKCTTYLIQYSNKTLPSSPETHNDKYDTESLISELEQFDYLQSENSDSSNDLSSNSDNK